MTSSRQPFLEKLNFNANGLIPAIAQDWLDGAILMMAWMNKESLEKTFETNEIHYWSRSRKKLWKKGETSGNIQILKGICYDCDADTILIRIKQIGGVSCHTGSRSCFFKGINNQNLGFTHSDTSSEVFEVIKDRFEKPKSESYTSKLFKEGDNKILKKIGEESAEFVMACKDNDKMSISNEAADLIYHLQVALAFHEVTWRDVLEVLQERRNPADER